MPEMSFLVRWPDGTVLACYSPSLVVRDYLEPDTTYTVTELVARSRTALGIASERVFAKYGFPCPRAAATLANIETKAREFEPDPRATAVVAWQPRRTARAQELPT